MNFGAMARLLLVLTIAGFAGCGRGGNPQAVFDHARQMFVHGYLSKSQQEAEAGVKRFKNTSPEWEWKFRILEAEALLWRGMYQEALRELQASPAPPKTAEFSLAILALEGAIYARLHRFPEAESALSEADGLCRAADQEKCGDVLRAKGVLANERGQAYEAKHFFEQSSVFARGHGDRFLEATALVNLGAVALQEEHFSEAVDWSEAAFQAATSIEANDVSQTALGNLGFAYYRLGDSERALDLFQEAENKAGQYGDLVGRVSWLTNIGYVQMDAGKLALAEQSYEGALKIATQIDAQQDIFNGLRALAKVYVQAGKLDEASANANRAITMARQSGNRPGELYPLLVTGQVATRQGDGERAEKILVEVESDPKAPAAIVWGAQHALARLYEQQGKDDAAERKYRAALATFEGARSALQKENAKLPFVTNAAHIYGDYIAFLVKRGRIERALEVADYSRARTLAEGLGRLRKGATFAPTPLNAQDVARRIGGTILFYWLGEEQSYVWTVTANRTSLASLAPAAEINAAVQRYRKALLGPLDPLEASADEGNRLYGLLLSPSGEIRQDSKVFVIPDGSLNSLNFETLIVSKPKPHYWIEDVTVVNASSLRMLASSGVQKAAGQKLLLLGDPKTADRAYPQLANAGEEIEAVRKYFRDSQERVLAKERATPIAYLKSSPGQYGFIHFVAHGTASRLSPLDSAVVLSTGSEEQDSFKLYARDILNVPLQAELVTISTCYGAGSRAYTGEGLVGLSWAFLRAGAHNVIGALWEVSDVSTPDLMEHMYRELSKGRPPETALRDAKLELLRSTGDFRRPFYWAPFQMYTGS